MSVAAPTADAWLPSFRERCVRVPQGLWIALIALLVLDYAWTARDLVHGWVARDRLVLGLVVLAGAAFLIWDRREEIARAPSRPTSWGAAFIAFSVLLLFVGTRAGLMFLGGMTSVFVRGVSIVSFLCGAMLLLGGWRVMWPLWLPAVLLLFLYPETNLTAYWVPLRLQTLAAVICEKVIALFGVAVVREGHVLDTPGFTANVEEACSGIRSLMTVVPTAIFISAYGLKRPGPKMALVLLAVPFTIMANVVRVVVTVALGIYVGHEAAEGFFHYFAGLGIFLLCLAGLLAMMKLLQLVEADLKEQGGEDAASPAEAGASSAAHAPKAALVGMGAALALGVLYQGAEAYSLATMARHYPEPALDAIPTRVDGWVSQELEIPQAIFEVRNPEKVVYREYRAYGKLPIQVLVLYWPPKTGGSGQQWGHNPEICAPYHGLQQLSTKTYEADTPSELVPRISLRSSVYQSPTGNILVTSTQQVGLRSVADMPRSYLGKAAFGIRQLLAGPDPQACMVVFQLVSPVTGAAESVMATHESFAASLVSATVDEVLRPLFEAG